MKRKLALFLALLLLTGTVSGCSRQTVSYREHLSDYVREMTYHDGFTILQLTDIHWNSGTQIGDGSYGSRAYLTKVINAAIAHAGSIDLIEITGDTFMLANADAVRDFIDFMTEINIPYAITWGNHDREGSYNPNWLSKQFLNAPGSLYTEVDNDDVHERCNYVINLTDANGTPVWQLAHLDSGASYREGASDLGLTYDYLRQDQLEWLTAEHRAAGEAVPVICYYHIAQADNQAAWELISNGNAEGYTSGFFKLEGFGTSSFASATEETFLANNVKAAFMGHAHAVDWTYTTPSGITYGLGVKSGTELYYGTVPAGTQAGSFTAAQDFDLVGASLVTLKDTDGSFTLEHLYYNEGDGNDFVLWVNYHD